MSPFVFFRLPGWPVVVLAALAWLDSGPLLRAEPQAPVSFRNEVMAVLSKSGCNAGTCHGNAQGKAGFKLSLRGEDPIADFAALTRDQSGRRSNPFDPDQSLLLLKALGQVAHEGGKRFEKNSKEHKILRAWVAAATPADSDQAPRLQKLTVQPLEKILHHPENGLQLEVVAEFSDGSAKKVNDMAVYEPANPSFTVDPSGRVTGPAAGETTVIVRFLDRQVAARLAVVPERKNFKWTAPAPRNAIDQAVFAKLKALKILPSVVVSDELFLRRAHLDLLGLLPTSEEARAFVRSKEKRKREKLVDALLQRPEFADFWALKWSDLLRNEERVLDAKGVQAFHRWIRQGIAEGKPMDQFAREIAAARGSTYASPAANFYRANRDPISRSESMAQVFLGTKLQCAQCHNHPFDRWTQDDYHNWAAVFSRVQYKILENRRTDDNDKHEFKGEQVVYLARKGEVKNPLSGQPARPAFLGTGKKLETDDRDELSQLAEWMTSNPLFAQVQANRIWFHLMGRGIVDSIDDFRATNPASNPQLLAVISRQLLREKYDLRAMIRMIMNSAAYQLSSEPNETNRDDESNFARAYIRRLSAEQLLDCQSQVVGVASDFTGFPIGTRAAQLPGARAERRRNQKSTGEDQFLEMFGKPPRLLTCECERSSETTMGQAFQLLSGPAVQDLISDPTNHLYFLAASGKADPGMVEELYWKALTRPPTSAEQASALAHLSQSGDRRKGLEDLTWALLNAKEFILRR